MLDIGTVLVGKGWRYRCFFLFFSHPLSSFFLPFNGEWKKKATPSEQYRYGRNVSAENEKGNDKESRMRRDARAFTRSNNLSRGRSQYYSASFSLLSHSPWLIFGSRWLTNVNEILFSSGNITVPRMDAPSDNKPDKRNRIASDDTICDTIEERNRRLGN